MGKSYLIFAPSYDSKSGGVIALHKLCHLLNDIGESAFLVQPFSEFALTVENKRRALRKVRKERRLLKSTSYSTNPALNTPRLKKLPDKSELDNFIVVYPDVVAGNPVEAPNVVRWFLHRPGFHTGEVHYQTKDLIYDYRTFLEERRLPGVKQSSLRLEITHIPTEIYNLNGALPLEEREGIAYCVKKGKGRKLVHDTDNAILIDNLSHEEIAAVFKRVKTFISYDTYTSYLAFAGLCGADSVVIPEEGVSIEQWHSNPHTRYGIAYGFEDLPHARETRGLLLEQTIQREINQRDLVKAFVAETNQHFYLAR